MKTKGFTLVELLVVIAILAILATVSVVGYTSFIDRAEQSNADVEANQIKTIIESALMGADDYVTLKDGIYVTKSATGYKVTNVKPTTGREFDAKDDVAALCVDGKTLTATTANGLVYKYSNKASVKIEKIGTLTVTVTITETNS